MLSQLKRKENQSKQERFELNLNQVYFFMRDISCMNTTVLVHQAA